MIYVCLRLIDLRLCMNLSFDVELRKCCLGLSMNSNFHELFDDSRDVFSKNSQHKSCSPMSLENFATGFTLFGVIERYLWPV